MERGQAGALSKSQAVQDVPLRLPVPLLERVKTAADKRDVPYQSLIKTWLSEKIDAA